MINILELMLHESGAMTPVQEGAGLGFELETNATTIRVILNKAVQGLVHYLEFCRPDGTTISSKPLDEVSNSVGLRFIELPVSELLTPQLGRYAMQYVGRYGNKVVKSQIVYLDVKSSINAGVFIQLESADFVSWTTEQIAEIRSLINEFDINKIKAEIRQEVSEALQKAVEEAKEEIMATQSMNYFVGVIFYGHETKGERLGAATGRRAGVNGDVNDFDNDPMFKIGSGEEFGDGVGITFYKDVLGNDIGKVKEFYVYHFKNSTPDEDDAYYEILCISPIRYNENYKLHPAFLNKDKESRGFFTYGKYPAQKSDDGLRLVCKSGKAPLNNTTITDARLLATAGGFHIAERRKYNALAMMFTIEFATRDSQSIFWGIEGKEGLASFAYCDVKYDKTIDGKQIIIGSGEDFGLDDYKATLQVGMKLSFYDCEDWSLVGVGQITSIEETTAHNIDDDEDQEVLIVTHDGPSIPWKTTEKDYDVSCFYDIRSGSTDLLPGSSAEDTTAPEGLRHFKYRGFEDLYGMLYWIMDGEIYRIENNPQGGKTSYYVSYDPSKYKNADYVEGATTYALEGYEDVYSELYTSGGYGVEFVEGKDGHLILVPNDDVGGSTADYYCDNCYIPGHSRTSDSTVTVGDPRFVWVGGSCFDDGLSQADGGLFDCRCDYSGYYGSYTGFRLSSDPS